MQPSWPRGCSSVPARPMRYPLPLAKERGCRSGRNVTRRGKCGVRDSACPRVDARADTGSKVDSLSEAQPQCHEHGHYELEDVEARLCAIPAALRPAFGRFPILGQIACTASNLSVFGSTEERLVSHALCLCPRITAR